MAPCQRLRVIVSELRSCLCGDVISTCVCPRLREQCLRSKITSDARVEIILLLRFVAGNVDVNTLPSKRSELLGNADILRMRRVIHNDSTCVCLRIPVAAITQKRNNASVDLWPALRCSFTGESTTTIYSRFTSLVRYDSTLLVYSLHVVARLQDMQC